MLGGYFLAHLVGDVITVACGRDTSRNSKVHVSWCAVYAGNVGSGSHCNDAGLAEVVPFLVIISIITSLS